MHGKKHLKIIRLCELRTWYAINGERTATNIRSISATRAFDAATQGTLDNHIDRNTQNLLFCLFIHFFIVSCWFPYGMCSVVLSKYVYSYLNKKNTTQHSCAIWGCFETHLFNLCAKLPSFVLPGVGPRSACMFVVYLGF